MKKLWPHLLIGALFAVAVALPWDLDPGPDPGWIVPAAVGAGIAGMLLSAWLAERDYG